MHAVIRTKGKQLRVEKGENVKVPLLEGEVGSKVSFDEVLSVEGDKGISIGKPLLSGAKVTATILGHGREKKILIWKHMRRKNYKKKRGHRQDFTKVHIEEISA
ncbi:MAG: 50S ribosomal protein L21 [Bdellovibrionota bacterium]